jgi:hypothetical protein
MTTNKTKKRGITLWVLVILFASPYILFFLYDHYKDVLPNVATSNNGDLISPVRSISNIDLLGLDNKKINDKLMGKWVLLTVANSACDQLCQKNIYHVRQIHRAMSGNSHRVRKLLVLSETTHIQALTKKLQNYPKTHVAMGSATSIQALMSLLKNPNPKAENGIYIIDPLGNYMMSYPVDFDAMLIIKDLERLLAISKLG